jgi:hypothetical protein
MLFATAAVLGLLAAGANAETSPMGGTAETSAGHFLQVAQDALARHENMAARVALEEAETRLLDRSVTPAMARQPDTNPQVRQIAEARSAIDHGDVARAKDLISQAMSTAGGTMSEGAPMESQPGMSR